MPFVKKISSLRHARTELNSLFLKEESNHQPINSTNCIYFNQATMKITTVALASAATISGAATADAVPSSVSGADGSGILKPAPAATAGSSTADPAPDPTGALFLESSAKTPGLTSTVSNVGGASDVDLGCGAASLDVGKAKTGGINTGVFDKNADVGSFGGSGQCGGGLSVEEDGAPGVEEEMAKKQEKMVQEDEEKKMTTKEEDVEPAAEAVPGADVGLSAEEKTAVAEGGASYAEKNAEDKEEDEEEGDVVRPVTSVLDEANIVPTPTDTTTNKQPVKDQQQQANDKDELQVQDEPKVVKANEKKEDENATAVTSGAVQAGASTDENAIIKTAKDQQQ